MAKSIEAWLEAYGESHQNKTNKLVHWICVPTIMFSLLGLVASIPFPIQIPYFNWATILGALALVFYLRLSPSLFVGFLILLALMLLAIESLQNGVYPLWLISLLLFSAAWVGQFIGHQIEGKKPSFLEDLKFLLIGPAWLLAFVYRRLGIGL